jgi:hypothetical protein
VQLTSLLALAAIVAGIYALWTFSPAVLDNLDVKEAITVAHNQAAGRTDDALKAVILSRLGRVGTHLADDGYGNVTEKTGLGLTPAHITIERDEVRGNIYIRVDYEREVRLKPTDRYHVLRFSPDKDGPLGP